VVLVRDAATVMLVRDGAAGLEVFVQRRSPHIEFGPGATVFPGGAVDPDDGSVPIVGRPPAPTDALLTRTGARRWFAAAAREAFEEAGFLLTTDDLTATLGPDVDAVRAAVSRGERSFADLLRSHGTSVAGDRMVVFSHWLTPEGSPRRYDTWFLLAAAPEGQHGRHDDGEAVHSEWARPEELLHRWSRDEIDLIFPTMRTLRVLEQYSTADSVLAALRAADAEATAALDAPWVVDDASGERVAHPFDPAPRRRGWRQLESRWQDDARTEAADRAERVARRDARSEPGDDAT
jgi:8-oxo-dGTP pyrophosphatase MutT (NUDIX family)